MYILQLHIRHQLHLPLLGVPQVCSVRQYLDCVLIGKGKTLYHLHEFTVFDMQKVKNSAFIITYELFNQSPYLIEVFAHLQFEVIHLPILLFII